MKDTFVLDVDGEEVTCEVILGFTDDATGKEYIIYTDNSSDEDDQLNIYASQVDPEDYCCIHSKSYKNHLPLSH